MNITERLRCAGVEFPVIKENPGQLLTDAVDEIDKLNKRIAELETNQQAAIDAALESVVQELDSEEADPEIPVSSERVAGWMAAANVVRSRINSNPLAELQANYMALKEHSRKKEDMIVELQAKLSEVAELTQQQASLLNRIQLAVSTDPDEVCTIDSVHAVVDKINAMKARLAKYESVDLRAKLSWEIGVYIPQEPDREYGWPNFSSTTFRQWKVLAQNLEAKLAAAEDVIAFYADPETYFAIGFIPDNPAGEFMDDFAETEQLGYKPGKRARDYAVKYYGAAMETQP